ncbi:hypothetical protein GCM10010172_18740 [Paractinoplanes ferrugineus]|uniref:Inositolphosphotransferase Aur1/Ipt1 domain-containing protein n=1 Tax=Paractinoplanes ferrugineus TaxID=113564 RepID=A0A919MJK6_9ACTN|nr:phosphatase PAP2 family protein [Actinoplanes ferrugineus]GIE14835.1 hypothetical protein Afe05nite_66750 [Actinoplanes ferrugineus]
MSRRRPAVLVELLLLTAGIVLFLRLRALTGTSRTAATADAHHLRSIEDRGHLDIEPATNRWLTDHPALIPPAVYVYRLYYLVLLGVLVWLYVRHREVYRPVRRTLLVMLFLALPVFWAWPVSPPRFAAPGTVDVVAEHDIVRDTAAHDLARSPNFLAMPSMHVAWAAWCAYAVWTALRPGHPRAALLAWGWPLLMTAVVLTTGNHYVLDVVGSAVLLAAAVAATRLLSAIFARAPLAGRSPAA